MAKLEEIVDLQKERKKLIDQLEKSGAAQSKKGGYYESFMSGFNNGLEDEINKRLDDIEVRLGKLESGGSFESLYINMQNMSTDFIRSYTDNLQETLRQGLGNVSLDLSPLVNTQKAIIEEYFENIAKNIKNQIVIKDNT